MSQAPAFVRLTDDWPVKRVRFLVSYLGSGKTPAGGAEVYQSSGVMLLRSQNVQDGRLDLEDVAHISNEVDAGMQATRVLPCDLLLNITGASIGRSCLVPLGTALANVNQHVCIIRSPDRELGRWLAACFQSQFVKSQIEAAQSGAGREGLNFEQVGNLKVNLPEVQVRDAVLSQLERALPRIDALIEKKTRFIELLREKRQALITQAVTQGLDPSVPMKDSGVDWLGQVPAHWAIKPLKLLARFLSGGTPSKENRAFWDGAVPWASAKDLKTERLADTQDHLTEVAIMSGAAEMIAPGAVLVVVRGMILARTFPVTLTTAAMAINQDLKALVPAAGITPEFLAWLLRGTSALTLSRLEEAAHGTKALRMESWVDLRLPVPPEEEQTLLCAELERRLAQIDMVIDRTARSTELLSERRSALITAAVTGQIDLREAA